MLRLKVCELGKVHIAPFVNPGFALWTVGDELVAEVRQPCLSAIPIDQASDALAAVAVAFAAPNLKETNGAFKNLTPSWAQGSGFA